MKPLVSVLIDTYNHEKYIEQAVVSAVEQDFPATDYEILVVDDGSTDRTAEIVRKFAPRVRLLSKKNGGQASAFNAAFPELCGEIVAFLDGDDWFAPVKLTEVVKTLEQHPEAAAVGHGYYEYHEATRELKPRVPIGRETLHLATPEAAVRASVGWELLLISAVTVRKEVLRRCGPLPEVLVFCGDAPIIATAMALGLEMLEKPLSYYRRHDSNLYAIDTGDAAKARRKYEIDELTFENIELLLVRLGVPRQSVGALCYPWWVPISRSGLREYGGSRLRTLRTEMRAFRQEQRNPSMTYRLFKYLVVGTATLLLPPRVFYRARDWYGHRNLGRLRERLASSR